MWSKLKSQNQITKKNTNLVSEPAKAKNEAFSGLNLNKNSVAKEKAEKKIEDEKVDLSIYLKILKHSIDKLLCFISSFGIS